MGTTDKRSRESKEKTAFASPASTLSGIQLTERDIAILHFINDFGFCEMPQIEKMFGLAERRSYQIMQRLAAAGLVKHERIFHGRHGIYRLTKKGAGYTDLPALTRISLAHYNHSLAIIDVYMHLRTRHPSAEFLSERHLIHDKYADGVGKRGHMPDGILLFPADGKKEQKIAIEVELRSKAKARIEKILKWYITQFDFKEIGITVRRVSPIRYGRSWARRCPLSKSTRCGKFCEEWQQKGLATSGNVWFGLSNTGFFDQN